MLALHLLGYPLDHPVLARGLAGLDRFLIVEGDLRRLEACQSPVWDTALAMVALRDAGVAPDHPAMARGAEWLIREEIRVPGDWAVRRPDFHWRGLGFRNMARLAGWLVSNFSSLMIWAAPGCMSASTLAG